MVVISHGFGGRAARRLLGAASFLCIAIGSAQAQTSAASSPAAAGGAQAQDQGAGVAPQNAPSADVGASAPDIVVTGFRASIDSALSLKRNSTSAVDAIVAQDIANFPDQNLAESLQRVPGISITRSRGEGSTITVRGLGPDFTRVRVNGMETVAATPGNGGRGFNFNIFASDLFNSIVVHKTAEAQLDEGSLGAVVDLNTGNPSAYKNGFTFVGSAKLQYNDLNQDAGPRFAGLIAYKDPNGLIAASVSAAYSSYTTTESGDNTVGWQQGRFNSVDGVPCFTANRTGGSYVSNPGCDAVTLAYHPRIPRYGTYVEDRERLGVTGSVEFTPGDRTKLSVDGLYAYYTDVHQELFGEGLLRSFERSIDVRDYTIDPDTGTLVAATFDNVQERTETRRDDDRTRFYQVNATLSQEFSDSFRATLFGGFSRSKANEPHTTSAIFDNFGTSGFSYDYAIGNKPRITLPDGITDPGAFSLTEIRDGNSTTVNKYKTAKLDFTWKVNDELSILFGGIYRKFTFDNQGSGRSTTYCAAYACAPGQLGLQVTDALSTQYTVPGIDYAPDGTSKTFTLANLDAIVDQLNFFDRPLDPDTGSIRSVEEKDSGAYFQFNVNSRLLGLDYSANAGVRYVHTDQSSTGINNAQTITLNRSYDDWLPSINLAFFPTQNLIVRAAIAKVVKRPDLGSLTPGGSVDGFGYTVNFGSPTLAPTRATTYDASVEWYFAPSSLISVAYFRKAIQSFPIGNTRQGSYASTGLPISLIAANSPAAADIEGKPWTISSQIDGPGGTLQGVEVGVQLPFRFLPSFARNLGFLGNVTYIDSSFPYAVSGPATLAAAARFPTLAPSTTVNSEFFGASKWSYNATLYYEDDRFSLRGSLAYRGDYNTGTGSYGNILSGQFSTLNLDMSSRLELTKHFALTLEGLNLTNQGDYPFVDEASRRVNFYHTSGRIVMGGIRLKF